MINKILLKIENISDTRLEDIFDNVLDGKHLKMMEKEMFHI